MDTLSRSSDPMRLPLVLWLKLCRLGHQQNHIFGKLPVIRISGQVHHAHTHINWIENSECKEYINCNWMNRKSQRGHQINHIENKSSPNRTVHPFLRFPYSSKVCILFHKCTKTQNKWRKEAAIGIQCDWVVHNRTINCKWIHRTYTIIAKCWPIH